MGRKIFYKTEEERKEAIRQSKLKYAKEKEWYCEICPGKNYRMAKKWEHLHSKQHRKNVLLFKFQP